MSDPISFEEAAVRIGADLQWKDTKMKRMIANKGDRSLCSKPCWEVVTMDPKKGRGRHPKFQKFTLHSASSTMTFKVFRQGGKVTVSEKKDLEEVASVIHNRMSREQGKALWVSLRSMGWMTGHEFRKEEYQNNEIWSGHNLTKFDSFRNF